MEIFLRIDINLITACILFFVWRNALRLLNSNEELNKFFFVMTKLTLGQLVIESLTIIINRRPELWLIHLSKLLHTVLFILSPIVIYYWYRFVKLWISDSFSNRKRNIKLRTLPLALNFVISGTSYFSGLVFTITDTNTYQRGTLFFVPVLISYLYLLYSCIVIIKNRKLLTNNELTALLSFSFLPFIGGFAQTVLHGALLMWSSIALGLIVVFIYLQQRMMQLDPVTGAWSRGAFEQYMENRVMRDSKDMDFAVIFIDLDRFKQINDNYGHLEGDNALKNTVEIIKKSLRNSDIIARFGGDEFVVLLNGTNRDKVKEIVKRIHHNFKEYNENSGKAYKVEYSYGYEIFDPENFKSIGHFLNHVDGLMYKNKEERLQLH